jgi:type I restriction enzyme S subunit
MTGLPAGWLRVSLADVAEVQGGIQKQQSRRPEKNKFPFLRVANVLRGSLNLTDVHEVELFDGELDRFRLRHGDLLVVEGNGSPAHIGRAARWQDAIPDCVHQNHLIRVRPSPILDSRYLELVWNSPDISEQLVRVASTTSGLYTLNTAKVKGVKIPFAPLAEQRRIVEILDEHLSRLDVGRRSLELFIKRLESLRDVGLRSIIYRSHMADETHSPMARPEPAGTIDGALPPIPESWRWSRLGEIAEVVGGITKDTKKQSDPAMPLVPYLRVANVQRGRLDLTNVTSIRAPEVKIKQLELRPGDVLLNEGGDRDKLGRGWIWEGWIERCIHQNHVFRARIIAGELHPKLLAWHANGFGQAWCAANGKQSVNLASISLSKIKLLPVPIPPIDQQAAIVAAAEDFISVIDNSGAIAEAALGRERYLRRSLLTEAFSGQLLTRDAADEPASELLARIFTKPKKNEKAPNRLTSRTAPTHSTSHSTFMQEEIPL